MLRAAIVSKVAPQTPTWPSLVMRHGPMKQFLQHMPLLPLPILHGVMFSARVKAVPMPSMSARMRMAWAAGSIERSVFSRPFLAMVLSPLFKKCQVVECHVVMEPKR